MKQIIQISSSQGSLGKNLGCEKAPALLAPEAQRIEVIPNNIEETNKNIEHQKGQIFIGGDHSITYPLFKAFAKQHKNPALLIFDAHADMANNFLPATHEDFNKTLIEQGILKPENLMIVGLRKIYDIEQIYLKEKNIKHMKEINIEQIKEFIKDKDLYVSIDIDCIDPQEAPGTHYQEPNGLTLSKLLETIKQIKPQIKRADLAEINPKKDIDNKTINAGKKILEILKS